MDDGASVSGRRARSGRLLLCPALRAGVPKPPRPLDTLPLDVPVTGVEKVQHRPVPRLRLGARPTTVE